MTSFKVLAALLIQNDAAVFYTEFPHGNHLPVLVLFFCRDPNISVFHIAPPFLIASF